MSAAPAASDGEPARQAAISRAAFIDSAAPGVVQPCFLSEPLVKILDDLPDSGPQLTWKETAEAFRTS